VVPFDFLGDLGRPFHKPQLPLDSIFSLAVVHKTPNELRQTLVPS